MPDRKISELDVADTLDGTEVVELVQAGANVKTTLDVLLNLGTPGELQEANLAAGNQSVNLDPFIGFLDCTVAAGNATITNLVGGIHQQIVVVSNLGPDLLVIPQNANFRLASDVTILSGGAYSLRFSQDLNLWVGMS